MGSSRNSSQYNNFQPKVDSNPIGVRRKRQRLPSKSPLSKTPRIEILLQPNTVPEAFPMEASDDPSKTELGNPKSLRDWLGITSPTAQGWAMVARPCGVN